MDSFNTIVATLFSDVAVDAIPSVPVEAESSGSGGESYCVIA
ncbi:hypothetical protein EWM64_g2697 [Hericium alpestre]|uniref:Fungal mating-type pheromone n=1 Tax=Hericium alpestre TaxID=135208 RepID=A0A4Z0A4G8_9AGAM|nr:hypothetical protein EWM64_g2697 [Hericium alpestre]